MGRHRSTSSISTLQITGAVVMLLVMVIVLALILAPDKPLAPPNSVLTYAERPNAEPVNSGSGAGPPEVLSEPSTVPRPPTPAPETGEPGKRPVMPGFVIAGRVVEEETGKAVSRITVVVRRIWPDAAKKDWTAREQAALASKDRDTAVLEALYREEEHFQYEADATSDEEGRFSIETPGAGQYNIKIVDSGYVPFTPLVIGLSKEAPKTTVEIRLSRGASIAGRVTEAGTSRGAAGVSVERRLVQSASRFDYISVSTDEDGYYTLYGLEPGEYEISLDLSDVPYGPGKVLPYRRVKVTSPRQHVTNINFSVEAAGVVWGYVTTPDQAPVGSDVILCTSESLLTQFMQAAIKQAPPVHARSRGDDGYYELVGVPLNKEWNVYVTTDDFPPQLSESFILTQSHRSARVDVFMFTGTDIYGYVTDTHGDPVAGAEVICVPTIGKLLAPM